MYSYKYQPNKMTYAVYSNDKKVEEVQTVQEASNIVEKMNDRETSIEKGFGSWGVPNFMVAERKSA